jgi:hypothetical protein
MKNMKTNWSSPKRNIFAAANDLRRCLASGYKARLIRILNEDCLYPILLDKEKQSQDFREYQFSYSTLRTRVEIQADTSMSDFEKYLSLNYKVMFGTADAVKQYYETGVLSAGNFRVFGRSHLVKVGDFIRYLQKSSDEKDHDCAKLFYYYSDKADAQHFYDDFHLKTVRYRIPKQFKHKVWAVEMCGDYDAYKNDNVVLPKISLGVRIIMTVINIFVYPLKYIPQKDILRFPNYKSITFRIGDVIHGYRVEFQIPKKFSFRNNK